MSIFSKTTARLITACVLTLGSALSANAARVVISQQACSNFNNQNNIETGDWSYSNIATAIGGSCSNGTASFEGSALGVALTSDSVANAPSQSMNHRQHVGTDGFGHFNFSLSTMAGFTDANIAITVNALMAYELDLHATEADHLSAATAYGRVVGRLLINSNTASDLFTIGHTARSDPNTPANANVSAGSFFTSGTELLTGTHILSATDTQFRLSLHTGSVANAAAGTNSVSSLASASTSTYASIFLQNIELPDGVCIQEEYNRYSACGAAIAAAVPLPASGLLLLGGLAGVGVMRRKRVS